MSPTLSEFCQGLRDFGPNLDSLSIDQNYVDLDGLICLLKAFPKLRKFEVGMILLEDHEIFEVLWQQENLKENLEEFTFKEPYSISECAEMVLRMLHECRSLRRVNLGGKMYVNQLLQLLGTAEANGYAFACHDLKVLEITVAGAGNWAPPAVLKERYDHTIIKPSDNNYERYDSLVRYLSKMPNLDLNSITFE
ncbi:hypothetical protein BGZ76_010952 [Entomortierella beljakovae]|nr:hypothetical protein BGZ76_010952 [Entomortierella beljakovae]